MKTSFLSFGFSYFLLFVFLSPSSIIAKSGELAHSNQQVQNYFNSFENDYPFSYSARIKRFHQSYEGFDYFAPIYTDINNYTAEFGVGVNIYTVTPYEFSNFEDWNRFQSSHAVWRYYNDSYYRKRVEMWNRIHNINWSFASTTQNPFGTFNFTNGFGLAGNLNNHRLHCTALSSFYYGYSLGDNNDGSLFGPNGYFTTNTVDEDRYYTTTKIQTGGVLPTINQEVVTTKFSEEAPDFTKHVTIITKTPKAKRPKNWRTLPQYNKQKMTGFHHIDLRGNSMSTSPVYTTASSRATKTAAINRSNSVSRVSKKTPMTIARSNTSSN